MKKRSAFGGWILHSLTLRVLGQHLRLDHYRVFSPQMNTDKTQMNAMDVYLCIICVYLCLSAVNVFYAFEMHWRT